MKNDIRFIVLAICAMGLSCTDRDKSVPTSAATQTTESPKPIIGPGAAYCGDGSYAVSRTGPFGGLDHYMTGSGKMLGFWQGPFASQLREKYGFNRAVIWPGEYNQYVYEYKYAPENLVVNIDKAVAESTVSQCPGVVEFITDEPYTKKLWHHEDVIALADYLHKKGKKYGIGEQGFFLFAPPNSALTYFNNTVMQHLDFVTFSNYEDWGTNTWYPDQRDTWTYMKQFYGAKFDRVWISSYKDSRDWHPSVADEYALLLGHASNLGINIAYLFSDGGTQRQLDSFCSAAWHSGGWLRRFDKEAQQNWCCQTRTYNPETCYMIAVFLTGRIVEVY